MARANVTVQGRRQRGVERSEHHGCSIVLLVPFLFYFTPSSRGKDGRGAPRLRQAFGRL